MELSFKIIASKDKYSNVYYYTLVAVTGEIETELYRDASSARIVQMFHSRLAFIMNEDIQTVKYDED